MKNLLVIFMVLAMAGIAGAYGLADAENPYTFSGSGNLTSQSPDVWGTWGGDAASSGSVVVAGGVCTFTTNSYEIAFSHDNALADIGNPIPGVDNVEVQFDVISISAGCSAIVKIEMHPASNSFPNPDNGTGAVRVDAWDPDTTITAPGHYTFSTADLGGPIDATTAAITPVVGCTGGTAGTAVVLVIDNFWVGKAGTYSTTKATSPVPGDGSVPGNTVQTLSWTNPDPINELESISCDVYWLDAGTSPLAGDPNMVPGGLDAGVVQIADDLQADTLDLSAALVTVLPLVDDHYYYWAVHCTDPNSGVPMTSFGDVWSFYTGDALAVVDAGVDQYNWVSKEDGDGNPLEYTITVTGTYTDDGRTPITDVNFVNLGWDIDKGEDGIQKISQTWDQTPGTIHTSGTVTAVYKTVDGTTVIPGYWDIQLQVTDGAGTGQDTVYVRVDADCVSATESDPTDSYSEHFDTTRDCIVNLEDLADFAAAWLSQSVKYE